MSDAQSKALPNELMVLCHFDGRIVTADREAVLLLGNANSVQASPATVSQIARQADCSALTALFERFAASDEQVTKAITVCAGLSYEVSLRRLNGFQSQPLIAIEMNRLRQPVTDQEQTALLEVGRATNRLLHDFKNQMSGLKLYAAYLKKRFAEQPEGVEIAEKIVQSLNEMTENASLIGKLTRPLDLKLLEEDFVSLIQQVVQNLQPQAAGRNVEVACKFAVAAFRFPLDAQQLRLAISFLLAQAIESSPASATVMVRSASSQNEMLFSISDEGGGLSEEQRQSFFDFLTNERLNKSSLGLALARRIIEAHGGTVEALAAHPAGKTISIKFGN